MEISQLLEKLVKGLLYVRAVSLRILGLGQQLVLVLEQDLLEDCSVVLLLGVRGCR